MHDMFKIILKHTAGLWIYWTRVIIKCIINKCASNSVRTVYWLFSQIISAKPRLLLIDANLKRRRANKVKLQLFAIMHNSNACSASDYYWRVPHSQGKSKSYSGMHVWSCNYHFTCKDVIIEYYSSHGIVFSSHGKLICAIKLIKQSDLELWIQFIIKNSVKMCNSCFCLWTINLVTSKHSPYKMCIFFSVTAYICV